MWESCARWRAARGHIIPQAARDRAKQALQASYAGGESFDAWLDAQTPFWGGKPANNYFKWFHVFEDELNHRGQIRWLRKRAEAR